MTLTGRVSIVTGASQGIGEAIALSLAQDQATVILVDIQKTSSTRSLKRSSPAMD